MQWKSCLNYEEELRQQIMVTIIVLTAYTHLELPMNSDHMKMLDRIRIIVTWNCLRKATKSWSLIGDKNPR